MIKSPANWHTYLTGAWAFSRTIDNGCTAVGELSCTPQKGDTLLYKEVGTLTLADQSTLSAENKYLLKCSKNKLQLLFLNNTLFQEFKLMSGNYKSPVESIHHCGDDVYVSTLMLFNQDQFTLRHTVTGPRKNYISETTYTRQLSKI